MGKQETSYLKMETDPNQYYIHKMVVAIFLQACQRKGKTEKKKHCPCNRHHQRNEIKSFVGRESKIHFNFQICRQFPFSKLVIKFYMPINYFHLSKRIAPSEKLNNRSFERGRKIQYKDSFKFANNFLFLN